MDYGNKDIQITTEKKPDRGAALKAYAESFGKIKEGKKEEKKDE